MKTIIFSREAKFENFLRGFMARQNIFTCFEQADRYEGSNRDITSSWHFLSRNPASLKPFSYLKSTINNYFHICGKMLTLKRFYYICRNFVRQLANETILRSVACLVDNIFVLVLADRFVFHPSVMLSDNRVSLAPTPKQMNIEKISYFPIPGLPGKANMSLCMLKIFWKFSS